MTKPKAMARRWLLVLVAVLAGPVCSARPPEIRNLSLRGLQIGAATTITIDGTDLLPAPQLFLDELRIDATVDPACTAARLVLAVPLPDSAVPGIAHLRIATIEGFSNSLLVGVDRLPQLPMAAELVGIQVAVSGSVPGSGVSRTTFPGKAGEDLLIEVEARRLGSKLRPVIHLYDSRRMQLAWAFTSNALNGDSRIAVKLPRDDKYTVEIHDSQYAPPGPSFFRLKIGQWQYSDMVFPAAVQRGQDAVVELLGNSAGVKWPIHATTSESIPIVHPTVTSGLPPTVMVSSFPELIETGDSPMAVPGVPVAINGRLNVPGQKDRFVMPVTPGMKIACEVFAERMGSRVDAVLELRNKQGAVLATNDDSPNTTDPRLEFTVPAGLDAIEVSVRDNLDLGRDDAIYRLVMTDANAPVSGFEVVMKGDVINVPSRETPVLETFVTRQGYVGPIQLTVEGLPPGVSVTGTEIPAGANGTLMGFANTGDTLLPLVTRISARSADGSILRQVRVETTPDDKSPAWMHEQIALAATPPLATPFQVAYANEAAPTQLVLASKAVLRLKITRPPSTLGPVRLSLVTSQPAPKINGQPNPNLAVRAERPVEIPVDNAVPAAANAFAAIDKQYAEAVQQAQLAQGDAKVAADAKVADLATKRTAAESALRDAEAKAAYQADYSIIVPSQLGESTCDISLRVELLNPDRNVVLRTTYLPIRRLPVLNPLVIKLDGTPTIENMFDPAAGATVKLTGKIERLADYKGDVTVTITGLPPGVSATNGVVKTDQVDFATDVKIPANFAANEINGLKLAATGPPDPLSGNLPVKSADVEISIKINRPAK